MHDSLNMLEKKSSLSINGYTKQSNFPTYMKPVDLFPCTGYLAVTLLPSAAQTSVLVGPFPPCVAAGKILLSPTDHPAASTVIPPRTDGDIRFNQRKYKTPP